MKNMFLDSILDLRKCPNRKTHESACFLVGALCKVYIITILKKIEAFWSIINKVKKIFFIVFLILRGRVQVFFQARKLIFLPNGLYLPNKQPWGSPKFEFCHYHL